MDTVVFLDEPEVETVDMPEHVELSIGGMSIDGDEVSLDEPVAIDEEAVHELVPEGESVSLEPEPEHCIELDPSECVEESSSVLGMHTIPGAPGVEILVEKPQEAVDDQSAKDGAKKPKEPKDEWDWAFHGLEKFVEWARDRYRTMPKHSGRDKHGLKRAINYLERLDAEVSKAMSSDYKGTLDADTIERIGVELETGIINLKKQLDGILGTKKADGEQVGFVKQANTARTGVRIVAQVPLLLLRLARTMINGTVSSGHDMKAMFVDLSKKWKLDDREQVELEELLLNMGYPILGIDRGNKADEPTDLTDGKYDFSSIEES